MPADVQAITNTKDNEGKVAVKILACAAALLVLAIPALAQDTVTIEIAESDEFGRFLTDSDGRPVYVFSADTPSSEDQPARISCYSADCREAWPLVTTRSEPLAGEGVDSALLGRTRHEDQQVVTYHGWPLYVSARDGVAETPQGHGVEAFGGEWSLLGPATGIQLVDIDAGESIYAASCAQCHGRTGRGMASFPSVAGKDADHISTRLMQYRARERIGPNSALMMPVAADLSDDEIANLAAFISEHFH